ncbi:MULTISPECIES: hypothetical protein [Achromobacter]|uniref:hypothetical protein n=1 Tax=Achromobacter TaxID=222 RepID=UPI000A51A6F4|nr:MULTISPECIES: hypothetical protein [Achromobacter]
MQHSIAFNTIDHAVGALFVQDSAGAVRPAAPKDILAAAREVVLQEIQQGQHMDSPKRVREFLQLRLNLCLEHEVFGIMYLNPRAANVLDHLVVAGSRIVSFAEKGIMP